MQPKMQTLEPTANIFNHRKPGKPQTIPLGFKNTKKSHPLNPLILKRVGEDNQATFTKPLATPLTIAKRGASLQSFSARGKGESEKRKEKIFKIAWLKRSSQRTFAARFGATKRKSQKEKNFQTGLQKSPHQAYLCSPFRLKKKQNENNDERPSA
jgi:hypothetical protein